MAIWTVYRVESLHNRGSGQSLERLGTVEAGNYAGAMLAAHETFRGQTNPGLPGGGLTIIEQRISNQVDG